MPAGRTHLKIEMAVLVACMAGVIFLWRGGVLSWHSGGVFLLAYLFSSLLLSPDLDLWQSRASQRWGIGRVLWRPYAAVFRHRRLSHHLLLGPLTRILYLGVILLLVFKGIELISRERLYLSPPTWSILGPLLCGLYLPNQIHILVDRLWSL